MARPLEAILPRSARMTALGYFLADERRQAGIGGCRDALGRRALPPSPAAAKVEFRTG